MALYTTLQDYRFDPETDDIRGARVFDQSEKHELGIIHDVLIEQDQARIDYVVVATGTREVLLPSDLVRASGENFVATMSREDFESLPSFDHEALNNPDVWEEMEDRYREALAKIGKPVDEPDLELPVAEPPPSIDRGERWDRFSEAVQRARFEIMRVPRRIA